MKAKQYRVSRTKKKLLLLKYNGVKEVIWRIDSQEQREEILRLGFSMIPWLYEIKTKPISNLRSVESTLVKDVQYSYKRKKRKIVCHIKDFEFHILDVYGIHYRPFKYKIILN